MIDTEPYRRQLDQLKSDLFAWIEARVKLHQRISLFFQTGVLLYSENEYYGDLVIAAGLALHSTKKDRKIGSVLLTSISEDLNFATVDYFRTLWEMSDAANKAVGVDPYLGIAELPKEFAYLPICFKYEFPIGFSNPNIPFIPEP